MLDQWRDVSGAVSVAHEQRRMKARSKMNAAITPLPTQRMATLTLVVGLIMISGLSPSPLRADQQLPIVTVGDQNGKITAVYQTTFLIDGRAYRLTPDAVIYDDSGNRIDAGYIGVGLEVKFHVKREQNDMIDAIVLYLPR